MELRANTIVAILQNVIGGTIVRTPLGEGLSVDAREAFLFSAIAGGSYFENQIFPFTPKGLLKIFYSANDYNFVTGIFDNAVLKNTPYYIAEQRRYIASGVKIIVPIEISSESQLRVNLREKYGANGSDPSIVLFRVDISKKGFGLEPLMEYLACKYFVKEGFVTENQIPLSHKLGSPDFGGYSISKIQDYISELNLLDRGFNVLELAMLRSFPKVATDALIGNINKIIVGEAKTSTQIMERQLQKYLSSGYFDMGIEIHPEKKVASDSGFGMLFIENCKIVYKEPVIKNQYSNHGEQKKYSRWLESYFNCYLLANYTNDELQLLAKSKLGKQIDGREDLISLVRNISFEDHLKTLARFLENGAL